MNQWRTLVRIVEIDSENRYWAIIPAWDVRIKVPVDLPSDIANLVILGSRLHARVNTGARNKEDLIFSGWEPR